MKQEYFLILEKIENIDVYIRSIIENSEEDDDNHPFIDKEDCKIYLNISEKEILLYTFDIMFSLSKKIGYKLLKKFNKIAVGIVCYILSIKYHIDCSLKNPYTYLWNIIRDIEDIEDLEEIETEELVKYTIDLEKFILNKTNFLTEIVTI